MIKQTGRRLLSTFKTGTSMNNVFQDLRVGARMARRRPGTAVLLVLVLAIGIGSSTAVFSIVNAILIHHLPYEDPERLVIVWDNFMLLGMERLGAKTAEYIDYRDQNHVFEDVAAFSNLEVNLSGGDNPERIRAARVSANLFALLGGEPSVGRVFESSDLEHGRDSTVILSDGLWRRRFGSDPAIAGKTLTIDGAQRTVIGVMPGTFEFPHRSFWFAYPAELWMPLSVTSEDIATRRGPFNLRVIARLKRDTSLEQARTDMDAIGKRLEDQYEGYRGPGGADGGWKITVMPLQREAASLNRSTLLILLAAVGCLLLIACANVGGILLARAEARRKEIAIRRALGGTNGRLARQLLTENLVLALAGGVFGLVFTRWSVDLLVWLNPANIAQTAELVIDWRVLAFAVVLSLSTWLICGVAPAVEASRVDLNEVLKAHANSTLSRRGAHFRRLLVVAEIALSSLLLVGAGLMTRSLFRLMGTPPGLNANSLLTAEVSLPASRYANDTQVSGFYKRLEQAISSLPGEPSVGLTSVLPLGGHSIDDPLSVEGRPFDPAVMTVAGRQLVSAGYFRTIGTPILEGRDFAMGDVAGAVPVAIVNRRMAEMFWPNEDPLGKRFKLGAPGSSRPWRTIVGVVANIPHGSLDSVVKPDWYAPLDQEPVLSTFILLRSARNESDLTNALRRAVVSVDRDLSPGRVAMMEDVLDTSLATPRFRTVLVTSFAAAALLLAVMGVYGLISSYVSQRTGEIGIRVALGAQPGDVLALVLRQGIALAAVGVTLGLGAALLIGQSISDLLWNVTTTDPVTFFCVGVLSISVVAVATYLPARRAMRLDPAVALRNE